MGTNLRTLIERSIQLFTLIAAPLLPSRAAEPVEQWAEYPRPQGASAPSSITFGNGVFVAAGTGATIITSTNGADWSLVSDPDLTSFLTRPRRVRFVHDRFFAFAFADNTVNRNPSEPLMSSDGQAWSKMNIGNSFDFPFKAYATDITFADGIFYAIAHDSIFVSSNAVDWAFVSSGARFSYMTHGNDQFAANSGGAQDVTSYHYSTDALNWNVSSSGYSTLFFFRREICYQNGSFFTVVYNMLQPTQSSPQPMAAHAVMFSPNGSDWGYAFRFPTDVAPPNKIALGGPYYVAPAANAIYYTTNLVTVDGQSATNWNPVPVSITAPETGTADIAFGNNVFVALTQGKIFKSNPISGLAPLRIVRHPVSYTANVSGTATFTAFAQGTDPISYQWRLNGANLAAATNSTLVLTNLTANDAGEYDAVITNPSGSVSTDKALLSVYFADVNLYAGVTLRGSVGDRFLLEYKNGLQSPEVWNHITNVTLTVPQSIWIDLESLNQRNRFYRATFLGR